MHFHKSTLCGACLFSLSCLLPGEPFPDKFLVNGSSDGHGWVNFPPFFQFPLMYSSPATGGPWRGVPTLLWKSNWFRGNKFNKIIQFSGNWQKCICNWLFIIYVLNSSLPLHSESEIILRTNKEILYDIFYCF